MSTLAQSIPTSKQLSAGPTSPELFPHNPYRYLANGQVAEDEDGVSGSKTGSGWSKRADGRAEKKEV